MPRYILVCYPNRQSHNRPWYIAKRGSPLRTNPETAADYEWEIVADFVSDWEAKIALEACNAERR